MTVYIRKGDISNPLLYDYMLNVSQPGALYLPFITANDLVGIYVDWAGTQFSKISI
jgi:hypothetical protein